MAQPLAHLRLNLDFLPSPLPDRPGLLVRDPFHYSTAALIIPPPLLPCLECFDGQRTDLDLRETLVKLTGELQVGEIATNLINSLSQAGFLHDEVFEEMRSRSHEAFTASPHRAPAHAGGAYPEDAEALKVTLAGYMNGAAAPSAGLVGIAAPHVSPEGGWPCYQAAYSTLDDRYRDRVFVVLGTSHYGEPERFGLTRKPFLTPLGQAVTEVALVDRLAAEGGPAVQMEDYCHSIEHSIEFQVVFLQHLYGPEIRVLPILCGPYAHSIVNGGLPEKDEGVKRFLGALSEMTAREGDRLLWVLGVDMAHMGRRYGDGFPATADAGQMLAVGEQDRRRIERISQSDAEGFWDAVQENRDALKWCGSSPFYTFLRAVPSVRAELLKYQQWNIDEQSVVSFGAMAFRAPGDESR